MVVSAAVEPPVGAAVDDVLAVDKGIVGNNGVVVALSAGALPLLPLAAPGAMALLSVLPLLAVSLLPVVCAAASLAAWQLSSTNSTGASRMSRWWQPDSAMTFLLQLLVVAQGALAL